MTRALILLVLCGAWCVIGCAKDVSASCHDPDPSAPVPECMTVCAHLFELECQVGGSVEECVAICSAQDARNDYPQVMRCYQAAASCDDVDGCSRGCGPDASAVPFAPVTINRDAADDEDGG
jgi:hypothetical protein